MNPERPAPPIASPLGSRASGEQAPKPSAKIKTLIPVHLSLESALRSSCAELLYPINFFVIAVVTLILTAILLPLFDRPHQIGRGVFGPITVFSFFQLLVLFGAMSIFLGVMATALWSWLFSPNFEVEIQQDGIYTRYRKRDVMLPWNKILWITHFNGDIWVACRDRGCLIPRKCFASREQSRHFARLVHQLWKSNGAAWNTTFGLINPNKSQ